MKFGERMHGGTVRREACLSFIQATRIVAISHYVKISPIGRVTPAILTHRFTKFLHQDLLLSMQETTHLPVHNDGSSNKAIVSRIAHGHVSPRSAVHGHTSAAGCDPAIAKTVGADTYLA